MIANTRPYTEMKDSGDESLGEVPTHWEVKKLRNLLRSVARRNRPELPLLSVLRERGVILRDLSDTNSNHNYVPDDLSNYKVVQQGQFAINKMKAWQGSYGVSKFLGLVSPAYFVFSLHEIDTEFFHSAIRSKAYIPSFNMASDGVRVGQWDLSQTRMREIPFAIPENRNEQTAIARFLDHATDQIERYIRTKEKLITLLEEQKQVMLHDAVAGRVDVRTGKPYPAYKPSRIEWLGELPAHWEVRKLGSLFRRKGSGTTPPIDDYFGGSVPWLMSGDLNDGDVISTNKTVTQQALANLSALKIFPARSLVVAMYGATIGRTGILSISACTNQACFVLANPRPKVNTMFCQAAVISARQELTRRSFGGGQPNINAEVLKTFRVPLPPVDEQAVIVRFLDKVKTDVDSMIDGCQREINLIREYRTRLIADVVTGKLDVREAATDLPELKVIADGGGEKIPAEPDSQQSNTTLHNEAPLTSPGAGS